MLEPRNQNLIGVYAPTWKGKIIFLLSFLPASLIAYDLVNKFAMGNALSQLDGFEIWLLLGLLMFPIATAETNLRYVVVDATTIKSASPLKIYRQEFRLTNIDDIRLTSTGRGTITEFLFEGRWIVFASNDTFKSQVSKILTRPH